MTATLTRTEAEAPRVPGPLRELRAQLEERADEFRMVLPSHISPEKFQRTVLTAVQTNPDLLRAERRSFLNACMKSAYDGLLPDGREAVLVVYKKRVKDAALGWTELLLAQYQPMAFGLRKKILQSGEVRDLFSSVVYRQEIEAGRFHYEEGSERALRHRPMIEADFHPTDDDIVLAYSIATLANGLLSFEILRRWEIDEIRESSQQGATLDRKGNPRDPSGPWVAWFSEMARKSVIRRHSKSLPQSSDIDVEAEDMALAAASVANLLGSRPTDEPPRLAGGRSPELAPPDSVPVDEPPVTDSLRSGHGRTGPEPEPEPEVESFPDTEDGIRDAIVAAERYRDKPGPEDEDEPDPEPEVPIEEQPVDELGVAKPAAQVVAEAAIKRIKATELLVDLRALEKQLAADLINLPSAEIATIDEAIERQRKRLATGVEPPQ